MCRREEGDGLKCWAWEDYQNIIRRQEKKHARRRMGWLAHGLNQEKEGKEKERELWAKEK